MSESVEGHGTITLPQEELEGLVSESVRLLGLAASRVSSASAQISVYASLIFDEVISRVNLGHYTAGIASALGEPLSTAADLIDCLGEDGVSEALTWAASTLSGEVAPRPINVIRAIADCMGWLTQPEDFENDNRLAAAVLVSFSEALNKWLEFLASELSR